MVSKLPAATISIRVQPRAASDMVVGLRDGVLIVRVSAPPLDGRANVAACRLVARILGVRTSAVSIRHGERAREKVVAIEGLDQAGADAAVRAAVGD